MVDIGPPPTDFASEFMRELNLAASLLLELSYTEWMELQWRSWLAMFLGYDPQLLLTPPRGSPLVGQLLDADGSVLYDYFEAFGLLRPVERLDEAAINITMRPAHCVLRGGVDMVDDLISRIIEPTARDVSYLRHDPTKNLRRRRRR